MLNIGYLKKIGKTRDQSPTLANYVFYSKHLTSWDTTGFIDPVAVRTLSVWLSRMSTFTDILSAERFSTYKAWANADDALGVRLYTFNVQLSTALYGPLHMLEIALRNATDHRLTSVYGNNWFDDPRVIVVTLYHDYVKNVRTKLPANAAGAIHGRMMAQLNFGFWSSLFDRRSHHLWQHLRGIFQAKGVQRGTISAELRDLRILRNRVAHYEPIVHLPLTQRYASIMTLTGWLSASAATWITKYSIWPSLYPGLPILTPDKQGKLRLTDTIIPFLPIL